MLTVRYSTRFRRDFKVCVKRRYDMELLQRAIDILRIPDQLIWSIRFFAISRLLIV